MSERDTLIETLDLHRGFLLQTADGLSEEQARERTTVSELTIATLLKHVADTEAQWADFAVRGAEAFGGPWSDFLLTEADTLDALRDRVVRAGEATARLLREADLDAEHPLPEAPWFEPGASWSVRRVALHVLAETAQHAGHADIVREAIDGRKTMG